MQISRTNSVCRSSIYGTVKPRSKQRMVVKLITLDRARRIIDACSVASRSLRASLNTVKKQVILVSESKTNVAATLLRPELSSSNFDGLYFLAF